MPLQIAESSMAGKAAMVGQRWTIRSIKGERVGTASLANCLGVVIHSPRFRIGCLAHIENITNFATYARVFDTFVTYMISKIAKYGGQDPGIQAGLFGNADGTADQTFTADLRRILIARGVAGAEITDQRNRGSALAYHDAGSNPRLGGFFGNLAYAPSTGLVECYGPTVQPIESEAKQGLRRKKLQ